ncbi:hydrogenase expression/formation protein HypE [uncultured Thiothrix sp.]|uniref:hydrogenase expression/formation protein HypE n=1 Tax=uncultured Thiothrix sp. TaxID=223185 RepID=UPI00263194B6|nr:hydrogenase expression/formation protein HypE [uncultured Thiothrix sp.]
MSNVNKLAGKTITLAHGAGGKAMRELIDEVFVKGFANPELASLEDQARFDLTELVAQGNRLALTTDSYVVDPLFFPGGDIGKLAVTGTVNDLAMSGAVPLYLTCGMILEEGFAIDELIKIVTSMKVTADEAGVKIVTGDTKVVHKGAADKCFINTAGVGVIPAHIQMAATQAQVGDKIIVNGFIGDHGAAIVDARGELALESSILSDCQPLHDLVQTMLKVCPTIHCLRDATRGGVATVLNEFAQSSQVGIKLQQSVIPIRDEVRGMCEILGLDPLYLANEGKLVAVVPPEAAEAVLAAMRLHPAGVNSVMIGEVQAIPKGRVLLNTGFGGERLLDKLVGEQLPRIC